jgi:hypothetical protein
VNLAIYLYIELEAKPWRENVHPLEVGRIGCPIKGTLNTMCTHKK